jgi:hypothetical protein
MHIQYGTTRCRAPPHSITWETQLQKDESPNIHVEAK